MKIFLFSTGDLIKSAYEYENILGMIISQGSFTTRTFEEKKLKNYYRVFWFRSKTINYQQQDYIEHTFKKIA